MSYKVAYLSSVGEYSAGLRNGSISADEYVFNRVDNTSIARAPPAEMLSDLFSRIACSQQHAYCDRAPSAARGTANLVYSGEGSSNGWHRHGIALNVLLSGDKQWLVKHPSVRTVWTCSQAAGDMIFVPDQYPHTILSNRGEAVLAIATQFVRPGMPALAQAAYAGLAAEVTALLAAGAAVDLVDGHGSRALHAAVTEAHVEIVAMLLGAGASAARVDPREVPPLHLASRKGHAEILRLLLDATAPVDEARSGDGSTALHHAAAMGHSAAVRVLLAAGARVHARTSEGETALHLAQQGRESGHTVAAAFLKEAVTARCRSLGWSEIRLPEQALWTGISSYYQHHRLPVLTFANEMGGVGDPLTLEEIYDRYEPRPSDVHIVTYPKAGTSWIQEVSWLVTHAANIELSNALTSSERTVYIELSSPRADKLGPLSAASAPRQLKWHHCAELLPATVVQDGRIIYLLRNPKDTVVSWYHMQRKQRLFGFTGTFDQFFDLFVDGHVAYGSYMHHVLSWWARRHQPNVLLLTYEQMHADLPGVVRTVAEFLGVRLSEAQVATVAFHCSFDEMKRRAGDFMRKGRVGDWRNYLSEEQSRRMDQWVEDHAGDDADALPMEYGM